MELSATRSIWGFLADSVSMILRSPTVTLSNSSGRLLAKSSDFYLAATSDSRMLLGSASLSMTASRKVFIFEATEMGEAMVKPAKQAIIVAERMMLADV
jgi:hypothetical protein